MTKYSPSILQEDLDHCFLCGRCDQKLDRHEVFGGALRDKSKRLGLWVVLCHERCHLGKAHRIGEVERELRRVGEKAAREAFGWSIEDFIREFGKNYE